MQALKASERAGWIEGVLVMEQPAGLWVRVPATAVPEETEQIPPVESSAGWPKLIQNI